MLTAYDTISTGSTVLFNEVLLNEGDGCISVSTILSLRNVLAVHISLLYFAFTNDRYDSSTGTFTVTPGGDGFYYFSTYFFVEYDVWARFSIEINGETLCTAQTSQTDTRGQSACSAAIYTAEGWSIDN